MATTFRLAMTLTLLPTLTRSGCPPPPHCLSCVGPGGVVERAVCKVCPQAIPSSARDVTVLGGCPIMAMRGLLAPFFTRLVNLQKLVLSNCGISSAAGPVFARNTQMTSLTLIGNNFSTFQQDVFTGLGGLQELTMGRDQIGSLPDRGFSLLGSLSRLDLRANHLTSLGADTFQGLDALSSLDLSANPLAHISPAAFQPLRHLQTLTLKTTLLTSLTDNLLSGLTGLKTVTFQGGRIRQVGVRAFAGTALQLLDLSHNFLPAVPSASLQACRAPPQTVDLSANGIVGLGAGDFARMNIHTLNLSSNSITTVQPGAFR